MKKIMILVLSLAVLFGFAACDNSSSTPDEGGVVGPNDSYNQLAATAVDKLLEGTDTVKNFLGQVNELLGTQNADYTSYSIPEQTLDTGFLNESDTTASLVVTGKQKTGFSATGGTVNLERYTLTFSAPVIGADGNYTTVEGSVSGYITGTTTVVIDAEGVASKITANVTRVFYPDTAKITYAGVGVDEADFVAYITKGATFTGADELTSIAAFDAYQEKTYQTEIATFVSTLLGASDGLAADLATNVGSYSVAYAGEAGKTGTATVTINGTEAGVKVAGTSSAIVLTEGQSLVISFAQDTETADPDSSANFTAKTFAISGSFNVYSAYTDAETNTPNANFTAVTVDLSGECTAGTITGTNADGVTAIASVAFDADSLSGSASAEVTVKAGPDLAEDNELAPVGLVRNPYTPAAN